MRPIDIFNVSIGVITIFASGIVGLIGAVMFWFGASGLIVGVHSGPLYAAIIIIFGSALLFIGYFCGRHGIEMLRNKSKIKENSS
jgi:hypothetical protein